MSKNTCPIIPERLARLPEIDLLEGCHSSFDEGACAMEIAAWLVGDEWTDTPACVCPTIGAFARLWNDALSSDEDRNRLLRPLIPMTIGTKGDDALAERRSYMALDWLIRVHTPRWLDLTDSLKSHAQALRNLNEIVDIAGATEAGDQVHTARIAVCDAARDSARVAAWDAALDSALDAAWSAARAAARHAALDAAGHAASDAAWYAALDAARHTACDAARNSAWDAAWGAARVSSWDAALDASWESAWTVRNAVRDALLPMTEWLQASASRLVERMCEVN